MKKYLLIPAILITCLLLTSFSGCTDSSDSYGDDKAGGVNSDEFSEISEEESFRLAEAYVRGLDSYREYGLTDPVLLESRTLDCPYCWLFIFSFDLVSEKDPSVIDTATVELAVQKGKIVDMVYVQGSRYKLGIPTGSMGVDTLLEKPVYDTEIFVYGTVSGLEKASALSTTLSGPSLPDSSLSFSFNLSWEGKTVPVRTGLGDDNGMIPAGLEDIENGDWVIVTGELKTGKESGTEIGGPEDKETEDEEPAPFFLAKLVQTEDISEDELFTGEVVQADEEKIVVREIPANKTAQAYRVRYEIREKDVRGNESLLLFKEEVFEEVSPKNPIEIEVPDVKTGSTYTIRALIRNMEGRILSDAEHVAGFDVEEVRGE